MKENRNKINAIQTALKLANKEKRAYSVLEHPLNKGYCVEAWYNGQKAYEGYDYVLTVSPADAKDTSLAKAQEIALNSKNYVRHDYIIYNGRKYDYEVFLNLGDYEIFDELYWEENQFTIQELFDCYCEEHFEKYGEEFVIN